MNKTIPVRTNEDKFFRQFLYVIRSVPPINKLRPKDIDVLAEILRMNNKYSHIGEEDRMTLIFSSKNRKEMMDRLGMKEEGFNNNLSLLRKAGIMEKNKLNRFFNDIQFDDVNKIEFIFKNS